jgi:hypothetical protein
VEIYYCSPPLSGGARFLSKGIHCKKNNPMQYINKGGIQKLEEIAYSAFLLVSVLEIRS